MLVGCKSLGLKENTCLALTLLLSSKLSLQAMVAWMVEEEEYGKKPTKEEVIEIAMKIKEYGKKKNPILYNSFRRSLWFCN